ncbi:MAG: flagellar biosynthesis protein FlhB [Planctomycetes bacterium RBG_13_44_8b]|nr:MAG: flagellar biosynthesis protein FlhB [Planctomycetes bacterium RBG_13_44_8b]
MPEKPAAERTEQPTPRRLQKAKEKGKVPQSQELASVATLFALVLTLALLAPSLFDWFVLKIRLGLSGQTDIFTDSRAFLRFVNVGIIDTILIISPILIAISAASILSGIAVGGFSFASGAIQLKWNAINPAEGLQKLINARSFVHLVISITKLFFVSVVVWLYIRSKLDTFATLRWAWSTQIFVSIAWLIFGLCIRVTIALLIIGIADALYQRWKNLQELKMTRQEVKQERKDFEGSPEVKSRIRRIQYQISMRRFLQEVPKADVILVNPTHVAVALRYEAKTMQAPILLAKGADHLAEKIVTIGRSYGIPMIRRPELARAIYSTVQPGDPIPENLYIAVAEVLALIYRLRQRKMAKH